MEQKIYIKAYSSFLPVTKKIIILSDILSGYEITFSEQTDGKGNAGKFYFMFRKEFVFCSVEIIDFIYTDYLAKYTLIPPKFFKWLTKQVVIVKFKDNTNFIEYFV